MNVNDVQAPDQAEVKCRLVAIFERQRELMNVYDVIERNNGLLQTAAIPVNLHDRMGQARLKDFAWRITEELTEAMEALIAAKGDRDDVHFREEMIDALHFFVELAILSGLDADKLIDRIDPLSEEPDLLNAAFAAVEEHRVAEAGFMPTFGIILRLGYAMNCLKNKPWKQTHILTDTEKYLSYIGDAFYEFMVALVAGGFTASEVFDLYFRKSEVNKFRQRSNY